MRRVTDEQVRLALQACGGRVAKAARVLGMARNNLYKRMAAKQIRPDDYRGNTAPQTRVTDDAHATHLTGAAEATEVATPDTVFQSAILRRPPGVRTLHPVSSTAPTTPPPIEEAKTLRLSRSVYLRPDQIKAIDDACLDLPRVLREKLSPSKVLEKFLDDRFEEWLQSKLEPAPKHKPARREKGK